MRKLLLIPLAFILLGLTPIETTDVNDIQSITNQGFSDIDSWQKKANDWKLDITNQTRYYAVSPADFISDNGITTNWEVNAGRVAASNTTQVSLTAGVHLPYNAIIITFRSWWYRNDASAAGECSMQHNGYATEVPVVMATVDSDKTTGYHTVDDSTITDASIDNTGSSYSVRIRIDANDSVADVLFLGALIVYTIEKPLP